MSDLISSILSQFDDNSLQTISKQAGATPEQAKSALGDAIPILMNALARNNSSAVGAESLRNAIARDHDGSLLDNLGDFLNNPAMANGAGILKHVLGGKKQKVESYISNDTGLSGSAASKILEIAAPIVMGYLGKSSAGGRDSNVLGGILNSVLNSSDQGSGKSQGFVAQLLDRDNDGSVIDDIAEMGMSFLGKMRKNR
ncbi:MAG: DUF937 domain-containing protein [Bacteroidales bacterium]|nr:DUF937 domain-containing protein [Bacteroidales bacterium]